MEKAWLGAMEDGYVSMMEIQRKMLRELWKWDMEVLVEVERRIRNVSLELDRYRRSHISQINVNREHILRHKLERLQEQHHLYWMQ